MQPPSAPAILRRDFLATSIAAGLATGAAQAADPVAAPFDGGTVKRLARESAAAAFKPADRSLPEGLAKLDYDAYRTLRFDPAQSLWRGAGLPFEAQFFHRGWLYPDRVDIFEVMAARPHRRLSPGDVHLRPRYRRGRSLRISASPGSACTRRSTARTTYDEVCVFLGASYFRAVAKHEGYGLSSRGLSLNTGNQGGEEFPAFRSFWLERPQKPAPTASSSTRSWTVRAVRAPCGHHPARRRHRDGHGDRALPARRPQRGRRRQRAPACSFFSASDRTGIDDYRRAVHDSATADDVHRPGRGCSGGRSPIRRTLQISSFGDTSPRGFGLVQRHRQLGRLRRSRGALRAPAEPLGRTDRRLGRGPGAADRDPHQGRGARQYRRLLASEAEAAGQDRGQLHLPPALDRPAAGRQSPLARFTAFRAGAGTVTAGARLFVLDLAGDALKALPADAKPRSTGRAADKGKLQNVVALAAPRARRLAHLVRAAARRGRQRRAAPGATERRGTRLSETWLYRWTA